MDASSEACASWRGDRNFWRGDRNFARVIIKRLKSLLPVSVALLYVQHTSDSILLFISVVSFP